MSGTLVLEGGPWRCGQALRGRAEAGATVSVGWRLLRTDGRVCARRDVARVDAGPDGTFELVLPLLPARWEGAQLRVAPFVGVHGPDHDETRDLDVLPGVGPPDPSPAERAMFAEIASDVALSEGGSTVGMAVVGAGMLGFALLLASAPLLVLLDRPTPGDLARSLVGTAIGGPAAALVGWRLWTQVVRPARSRRARFGTIERPFVRLGERLRVKVDRPVGWSLVRIERLRGRRLEAWPTVVASGTTTWAELEVPVPAEGPPTLGDADAHVAWEMRLRAGGVEQRLPVHVLPGRAG